MIEKEPILSNMMSPYKIGSMFRSNAVSMMSIECVKMSLESLIKMLDD